MLYRPLLLAVYLLSCFFAAITSAAEPPKLRVGLYSFSGEYKSAETLPAFKEHLEKNFPVTATVYQAPDNKTLPGLDALEGTDVMVLFVRRMTLPEADLAKIKKFCESGRGIVGIRTASHAFQNWLEYDADIQGGNYKGHYGDKLAKLTIAEPGKNHPVLRGVQSFNTPGKLYKNPKLADDVTLLLQATADKTQEPVAWARELKTGGRVVYTSLGVPADFDNENFRRFLSNAVLWTGKREAGKP